MLNKILKNKSENWFCISFKTLRIFWDQTLILATFEEVAGGERGRVQEKTVGEKFIILFRKY